LSAVRWENDQKRRKICLKKAIVILRKIKELTPKLISYTKSIQNKQENI
jgi:hypothetical protein